MADLGEGPGSPGSLPPYFGQKKEEMTGGKRLAGQVNQDRSPPPHPHLAQGLDPPLKAYP